MNLQATINLEEIKTKLIDKFRVSGWSDKLKGFLFSSDFDKIIETLYDERVSGKRFTPPLKLMFSAFEKCRYPDLKVVIVGQDPYPRLGQADGMAFSCSHTEYPLSSLKYIFQQIESTVYPHEEQIDEDPDLTRWAEQGVLLLNSALTTQLDKPGTHQHIWKPFMAYLLDMLNSYNSGLIFVFMGQKAQELADLIDEDQHYKFLISHPNSALYQHQEQWDSQGVFVKINEILERNNGDTIVW